MDVKAIVEERFESVIEAWAYDYSDFYDWIDGEYTDEEIEKLHDALTGASYTLTVEGV